MAEGADPGEEVEAFAGDLVRTGIFVLLAAAAGVVVDRVPDGTELNGLSEVPDTRRLAMMGFIRNDLDLSMNLRPFLRPWAPEPFCPPCPWWFCCNSCCF